jgi:hypothetical protein
MSIQNGIQTILEMTILERNLVELVKDYINTPMNFAHLQKSKALQRILLASLLSSCSNANMIVKNWVIIALH